MEEEIIYIDDNYNPIPCSIGPKMQLNYNVSYGDRVTSIYGSAIAVGLVEGSLFLQLDNGECKKTNSKLVPLELTNNSDDDPPKKRKIFGLSKFSSYGGQLFNDPTLSDFSIEVGECVFYLHKVILSLRCDKFRAMFTSNCSENKTGKLKVICDDAGAYSALLKFLYDDNVEFEKYTVSSIISLVTLAHEYLLWNLVVICNDYLISQLTVENVCLVFAYVSLHDCKFEKLKCLDFIAKNNKLLKRELRGLLVDELVEIIHFQSAVKRDLKRINLNKLKSTKCFALCGMLWEARTIEEGMELTVRDTCGTPPTVFEVYMIRNDGKRVVYLLDTTTNEDWDITLEDLEGTDNLIYIEKLPKG